MLQGVFAVFFGGGGVLRVLGGHRGFFCVGLIRILFFLTVGSISFRWSDADPDQLQPDPLSWCSLYFLVRTSIFSYYVFKVIEKRS